MSLFKNTAASYMATALKGTLLTLLKSNKSGTKSDK